MTNPFDGSPTTGGRAAQAVYNDLTSDKAYDDELENYSRLRLELGALTSLSRIERIAVEELNMTFPDKIYGLVD